MLYCYCRSLCQWQFGQDFYFLHTGIFVTLCLTLMMQCNSSRFMKFLFFSCILRYCGLVSEATGPAGPLAPLCSWLTLPAGVAQPHCSLILGPWQNNHQSDLTRLAHNKNWHSNVSKQVKSDLELPEFHPLYISHIKKRKGKETLEGHLFLGIMLYFQC